MLLLLLACSDYSVNGKAPPQPFDTGDGTINLDTETGATDTEAVDTVTVESTPEETDTAPEETGEPELCRKILVYSTEARSDRANYLGFFDGLETDPTLAAYDTFLSEAILRRPNVIVESIVALREIERKIVTPLPPGAFKG